MARWHMLPLLAVLCACRPTEAPTIAREETTGVAVSAATAPPPLLPPPAPPSPRETPSMVAETIYRDEAYGFSFVPPALPPVRGETWFHLLEPVPPMGGDRQIVRVVVRQTDQTLREAVAERFALGRVIDTMEAKADADALVVEAEDRTQEGVPGEPVLGVFVALGAGHVLSVVGRKARGESALRECLASVRAAPGSGASTLADGRHGFSLALPGFRRLAENDARPLVVAGGLDARYTVAAMGKLVSPREYARGLGAPLLEIVSRSEAVVSGREALRLELDGFGHRGVALVVFGSEHTFVLEGRAPIEAWPRVEGLFRAMLESFRLD